MPYNYTSAKDTLTEAETARIVCVFLNMDQSLVNAGVNWELAKTQIGSASIESLKKGLSNTLKKLDKVDDDGTVTSTPVKKTPAKKTPSKKTPASKKRKATADAEAAGDDAEKDGDEGKPALKKEKVDSNDDQV